MKVLLDDNAIQRILSQPTKLPTYSTSDSYQMERYRNLVREAAIVALSHHTLWCLGGRSYKIAREESETWLAHQEAIEAYHE